MDFEKPSDVILKKLDFKRLSNREVEERLKEKTQIERLATLDVIALLEEVDKRKIFLERGFSSLLEYCVKELKYSEGSAYRRISAMRVVREMPEVAESIGSGSLSLMNVAQAQSYFRAESKFKTIKLEDKKALIAKLENKSARETEKIILELAPQSVPKESIRQITANKSRVTLVLSDELVGKLEKLKDLLSHKMVDGSYVELIDMISDLALKKLNPMAKKLDTASLRTATPALESEEAAKLKDSMRTKPLTRTRYIPIPIRRKVWQKSQGQCSFCDPQTGRRCSATRFLEIDHKYAYSRGGENSAENLQLLCDAHNRWKGSSSLKN